MILDLYTNYTVSTEGDVINRTTGRFLKLHKRGMYLSVKLYLDGVAERFYVHRLVAEEYITNPLKKKYVNHLDGNKLNNRHSNLEWCTHSENCIHRNKVLGKSNEGRKGKVVEPD